MFPRFLCSLSVLSLSIAAVHAADLDTPRLQGIDNFRDVAGITTAYSTTHDGTMRSGVFYRSNALTPTASDLATLNGLGIKAVYDLRTPSEIAATPDTMISGATYQNIDIIGATTSGANITTVSFKNAAEATAMMQETNRAFVSDAGMRGQLGVLFNELAGVDGAALFHCTAGKDRTGWTAAVLQSIAGVDNATIMSNYLATNDYTADRVAKTLAMMPPSMAAIYAPLLGVEASYLQAGLDQVAAQYGSMDNYLKQGLGLSQETIYVLRGKMVEYNSLPGQVGLIGNAAAGAQLLRELQNSKLSGTYSAYNYYLQSAIDAGTLGGVESTVGGQVHADAASYLLRQNAMIEQAAAPFASGTDLKVGHYRLWSTALAGYLGTDGSAHAQSSNEHSQGLMVGVTQRFSEQFSARGGIGYSKGSVGGAGGEADTDFTFLDLGARYGFTSLQRGLFVDANLSAGYVDYDSKRDLGGGLGSAKGDTNGNLSGATLALGYRMPLNTVILEPSLGVRVSRLDLSGFQEKGSELALNVDDIQETRRSAVANLDVSFAPMPMGAWQLVPGVRVGYEHVLGDHQVDSEGHLLGLDIEQRAAFDNRDQFSGGVNLMANLGALSLGAEVGASGGGDSHGFSGGLKASYQF
ncbi:MULTISPECIES: tyrosine-protein phosphatase [unclassified Pseudomonas]|uniref:tyrosine-protein phosphatase n=1 Tax=unclassified Pseudomonas TaxID=196821 RepID=UPI000C8894E9|nr:MULTISPECIES: tyrosine-protein phosphatase [unclassified Pseudomonas]PNA05544.1 autotransporter outer membrane beta-barrel domain-containing protein [Pseudomonas sp. FW305-BF15]PNB80200.1 autotransporter outer membrane beta-barrel domain-containing protein [Pseudomonas sp. FW305-BF6]